MSDQDLERARAAWLAASDGFGKICRDIAERMGPIAQVADDEAQRRLADLERRKKRDLTTAHQRLDDAFGQYVQAGGP